MSNVPKPKASTQDHLDIEDIRDDMVILRTGWVALVMSTTAVNFDLLSEAEQDATIYAYGAFLNSLSFPVQTLIRSKKADITAYFNTLEEAEAAQPNPDLKRQIQKYKDFIQATVQQKTVLDKKFYLIVNYSPLEGGFKNLSKSGSMGSKSKGQLIEAAKAALAPKRDHVVKQTARLGLATRQLTTQELIELFYDIYNPAPTGTQRVLLDTASYTTPIVEPAIENPTAQAPTPTPVPTPSVSGSTMGSVAPGGSLSNLRPVPIQNPTYTPPIAAVAQPVVPAPTPAFEAPVAPTVPLTPAPVAPMQQPAATYQGQGSDAQAQALQGLQEIAAKAAQLMPQPTPQTVPQAQNSYQTGIPGNPNEGGNQ